MPSASSTRWFWSPGAGYLFAAVTFLAGASSARRARLGRRWPSGASTMARASTSTMARLLLT